MALGLEKGEPDQMELPPRKKDTPVMGKASVFAFRSLHPPSWRIRFFSNPLLLAALTLTIGAQVAA